MSVVSFDAAIAASPNSCIAVVSPKLFYRLDQLGRLQIRQLNVEISEVSLGDGNVRKLFRTLAQKTQHPITLTYFVMAESRRICIELAALWDLTLDDDGPNSFTLGFFGVPLQEPTFIPRQSS